MINQLSKERVSFEAYILSERGEGYLKRTNEGPNTDNDYGYESHYYEDHFVQEAWEAWQARANSSVRVLSEDENTALHQILDSAKAAGWDYFREFGWAGAQLHNLLKRSAIDEIAAFGHFQNYVVKNMPVGTVTGDPTWWAARLWRALFSACNSRENS